MKGLFFSFDGVDGVGKSTQMTLFIEWLRGLGLEIQPCRDPGSTKVGEAIREIVLHKAELTIDPLCEMFLYMTSRSQLVSEVIRPSLDAGKVVVSDRFLLSNVAYQGYGGGLGAERVWNVGAVATGGLSPTLTFLLDMPAEQTSMRLERALDRMESRGGQFLERVRQGFLTEARRMPESIAIIDAGQSIAQVQADIRAAASRLMPGKV